jgi:urease accessory protein UreH
MCLPDIALCCLILRWACLMIIALCLPDQCQILALCLLTIPGGLARGDSAWLRVTRELGGDAWALLLLLLPW